MQISVKRKENQVYRGFAIGDGVNGTLYFTSTYDAPKMTLDHAVKYLSGDDYAWMVIYYKMDGSSEETFYISPSAVKSYMIPEIANSLVIMISQKDTKKIIYSMTLHAVDLVSSGLTLDISEAKTSYIWVAESGEFDTSGVKPYFNGGEVDSSYVTYSHEAIDYTASGTYAINAVLPIRFTFTGFGDDYTLEKTYSASYSVTARPFSISSVEMIGTDPKTYYSTGTEFSKPSGATFRVNYDTGSSVDYRYDGDRVTYWLDEGFTETAEGAVISSDTTIYVRIETGDFAGNVGSCSYGISVTQVKVSSVSASGEFVLSNTVYAEWSAGNISITAEFTDGSSIELPYSTASGFYATNGKTNPIYSYTDAAAKTVTLRIYVNCYGATSGPIQVVLGAKAPSISSCSVISGDSLSTSIVNGAGSIDLTDTRLSVSYSDSDYVDSLVFGDGSSAGTFSVGSAEQESTGNAVLQGYSYDGSENVSIAISDGFSDRIKLLLSGRDRYGSSVGSASPEIAVSVYEVTDILGISLISAKISYSVGEAFLNPSDDTSVRLYFEDASGDKRSIDIPLSSSYSSLSIYPTKGTVFQTAGSVTVRVQSVFDTSKYVTYDLSVSRNVSYEGETKVLNFRFAKLPSDWEYGTEHGTISLPKGTYVKISSDEYDEFAEGGSLASSYDSEDGIRIYGYLKNVYVRDGGYLYLSTDSGKSSPIADGEISASSLVDFNDYLPEIDGDSNCAMQFPCYDPEASSFVDGCSFGVRFGHNNSLNRLFISGNPDKPNYDIHSCEPNLTNEDAYSSQSQEGDFSYFPDEAMCKYGEAENSVVGYDVVSNTKLLVLKDRSSSERTVYFRIPYMATMLDSSGNAMLDLSGNALTQEEYQVQMSNSSVSGISNFAIANFNGDTLFVDEDNEIAGLDIEGIIGDSQRQASSRSHFIDGELASLDLSESSLFTFGKHVILDVPGKACYAAERGSASSGQYGWWKLDPMNSRAQMELYGTLYFSDPDGGLWKISDGHSDRSRAFCEAAVSVDDYIVVPTEITDAMGGDCDYSWETYGNGDGYESRIYAHLFSTKGTKAYGDISGDSIMLKATDEGRETAKMIGDLTDLYICGGSSPSGFPAEYYGKPFHLIYRTSDDADYCACYSLTDGDGNALTGLGEKFPYGIKFCVMLEGGITAAKKGDGEIRLIGDGGKPLDITTYGEQTDRASIKGALICESAIASEFVTAPLLISSSNWFKHIIKMDVTQGSDEESDVSVAYCSNRLPATNGVELKDPSSYFNLNDLSFKSIDFATKFPVRAYTIAREIKAAKYVCVAFASRSAKDSVLPTVSLTYSVSRLSRGIGD